jgi:threonyl-tRNA synthetase
MKLLSLHCDYIKVQPKKKALKDIGPLDSKEEVKIEGDPLCIFIAVEKSDEASLDNAVSWLVENIKDLKKKVGAEKIVLYPYAHLSSQLSSPSFASDVLENTEKKLKKEVAYRAPFGYYKSFELKCKGHPLSELTRRIGSEDILSQIETKEELIDYKNLLRSISKSKLDTSKLKENDHRILGKNLDFFSFSETAPGMVFWHNKGLIIKKELIKFWREEHQKAEYEEIESPQILDKKLWQISGHWDKYKENIFLTKYEGRDFAVKPMNCPGGMLVFKNSPKSYKDLPLRVGELGVVHRQELSGVLAGLFRLIRFTQDDAHIFCTEEQLKDEIIAIMDLIKLFYKKFNIGIDHVELSTRPKKRIGDEKLWDKAEKELEAVLKKKKIKYQVNKGDGAFYGPKIDFHVKDSLGRTWQLATIQLDMALPERFDLAYTAKDNSRKRPIMLHRVIYGAIERFLGILLEHTNGNLPLWISPTQVRVLSFTDRNIKVAEKILKQLNEAGIRADGDFDSTTVNDKVRTAELQKIPYIITIGDKEEKAGTLAIRKRGEKKLQFGIKIENLIKEIQEKIENREN